MELFRNGVPVYEYQPEYSNKNIIIAIDSSKSNSALVVGNEYGDILNDYEISGAGSDVDVYQLCWDTRKALTSLLKGANIIDVGIEDIITKRADSKKNNHLDIHQSRSKITAVFNNFIFFFQDRAGFMPRLIDNWSWKSHVLPEEYRTREHKKGSLDWFNDLGNKWAGRKDDVTDCVCIFMYMMQGKRKTVITEIKETIPTNRQYSYAIFPTTLPIPAKSKTFVMAGEDKDLEHYITTVVESIADNQFGILSVKIDDVPLEMIYSSALKYNDTMHYDRKTDTVFLVIRRV